MKKGLIVIGVLLFAMTLFVGSFFTTYNLLVNYRGKLNDKKILIDDSMEKKAELVPKLISYTEVYLEDEVVDDVSQAREELLRSNGIREKTVENENLTVAIDKLIEEVENNPSLNKNGDIAKIKREISSLDNTIDTNCREYNEIVNLYNDKIKEEAKVMAIIFNFDEVISYDM